MGKMPRASGRDTLRLVGRPPTTKTTKTTSGRVQKRSTIVFRPETWKRLVEFARKDGRPLSWIIDAALIEYMDRTKAK